MSFTGAFPANTIKLCSVSPIKLRVSFYSKLLEQYLAMRGSISLVVMQTRLVDAHYLSPRYIVAVSGAVKIIEYTANPVLRLSVNIGAKMRDALSLIPPLMLFVGLRAVLNELYSLKDPYLEWGRSNWVNAVMSKSSIPLDYINQRLNLNIQPVDKAAVNLGGNIIEASAVVLGVEAGTRSYAIYFAIGLGTLYLTYQSYPLTITLHSGSSVVLVMSEQILFIGSEDRVYGADVYTMVLHVRDDPVVIWTLDNRSNALGYFTLNCSEGSYKIADLKSLGSDLEYKDGFLTIRNPPQCSNPVLRVYASRFTPYTIEPGKIVFKVVP